MLWNRYQNDLSYQVSNANLNMYADDHQLYTMGSNANTMKARLESEAGKALTWYNDNYPMVNPDKFQLLMINSQNDNDQASLTINAHVIESTADISFLGVNVDEHLVFNKHLIVTLYGTSVKPPTPEKLKKYSSGPLGLCITYIQKSTLILLTEPIYLACKIGIYKMLLP